MLIRSLEDECSLVRIAVADALGEIAHPASAEALASALTSLPGKLRSGSSHKNYGAETDEYEVLAKALARVGTPALKPLLGVLEAGDREPRRWAACALGILRDPQAVNPLIRRLEDARSEVRKTAALALGQIGELRALSPLIKALAHKDLETRRAAAEALGFLGSPDAVDALVSAVADQSERVQIPSIQALAKIGGLQAAECLRTAMNGSRKSVRDAAETALCSLEFSPASAEDRAAMAVIRGDFDAAVREGSPAIPALIKALGYEGPKMRAQAAAALGSLRSTESVRPLAQACRDHDAEVQKAAVKALVGLGTSAREELESLLGFYDASVAGLAAGALGEIGDIRSMPSLLGLVEANRSIPNEYQEMLGAVRAAIDSLSAILASSAESVPHQDLIRVSELPAMIPVSGNQSSKPADCTRLRSQAAEELLRRKA